MDDSSSFRETRLEPLGQRLKRLVQQLRGGHSVKDQRVYRVEIGNRTLKRIAMPSVERAAGLASRLRVFRGRRILPDLVAHHGADVWVEFIEGEPVGELTSEILHELARIFAVLYARAPQLVSLEDGPWLEQLHTHLGFLYDVGVLDGALRARLERGIEHQTPAKVWIGHDYSDPRAANLLRCPDGSCRFIDVESVSADDALLGTGVAKACNRWLGDRRDQLLSLLRGYEIPPIEETLLFVELQSLSSWTVRSLLHRKQKLVQPKLFRDFADRCPGAEET